MAATKKSEVPVDRRAAKERRAAGERRQTNEPVAKDLRKSDRRKVQRRRQIDPTTCERDYTDDEIEFMQALDAYKRANGRMFPTCSEILEVIRDMGYIRVSGATDVEPKLDEAGEPNESSSDEETGELELNLDA